MHSIDVITFGEAMAMFIADSCGYYMRYSILQWNWQVRKQM